MHIHVLMIASDAAYRLHDVAMSGLVGVLDEVAGRLVRPSLQQPQRRKLVAVRHVGERQAGLFPFSTRWWNGGSGDDRGAVEGANAVRGGKCVASGLLVLPCLRCSMSCLLVCPAQRLPNVG